MNNRPVSFLRTLPLVKFNAPLYCHLLRGPPTLSLTLAPLWAHPGGLERLRGIRMDPRPGGHQPDRALSEAIRRRHRSVHHEGQSLAHGLAENRVNEGFFASRQVKQNG